MFTFHIIPNFYIPTNKEYLSDAFTQLTIKACRMLTRAGHRVHFYGVKMNSDKSEKPVECTDYHGIVHFELYREFRDKSLNFTDPCCMLDCDTEFNKFRHKICKKFSKNLEKALLLHYREGDIVLNMLFSIINHRRFPQKILEVEFCKMGCTTLPLENTVFITKDYYDAWNNKDQNKNMHQVCKVYKVILPWFYPEDFTFRSKKRDSKNYLFLARCQKFKGIHIFLEISKHFPNDKFIIAGGSKTYDLASKTMCTGTGEEDVKFCLNDYPNVVYVGVVNKSTRRVLLSNATALIQPTTYREPCGWNVIEALMSGTPAVASNFGGFVNTVRNGIDGYLCQINEKFNVSTWVEAVKKVDKLNRRRIYNNAIELFSEKRAYNEYMNFFHCVKKGST